MHRLAAVAFTEDGRQRAQQDPTLEACHRILSYPGSERDMNPSNIYLGSGELNRSQLVCKILFLNQSGYRDANAYALAVSTPRAQARDGFLWNQAGSQERFEQLLEASQRVSDEDYLQAEQHVHVRCVEVHTEEKRCLFYHRASEVARTYGLGLIPSVVASRGAIPDFGENLSGEDRRLQNVQHANIITGLDLPS